MRAWIDHLRYAAGWSMAGLRVLFTSEAAARMELMAAILGMAWLLWLGRSWLEIGGFGLLCLITLAAEALNTAIEAIVDEISPQRSAFAGRAKDLGSAAVFLMVTACSLYLIAMTVLAWS